MWVREYTGQSSASPERLFDVLADAAAWSEWNPGVAGIDMDGPFEAGTTATMRLSDDTVLPFRLVWVEAGRGFEDETPVPDAGVVVRVLHELTPLENGTRITYRCIAEGPEQAVAEVGAAVSADFPDVIAALAARAEDAKR
jgi:uncharacterized protein YndB with AHSA1/START domain